MRLVGQVRDDVLEVAGDVADGDVLLGELRLEAAQFGREPFGERLNRVSLGFLDHLALTGDHLLDRFEQLHFGQQIYLEILPDPVAKIVECTRHGQFGNGTGHFLVLFG